jgi:hypothetical protein
VEGAAGGTPPSQQTDVSHFAKAQMDIAPAPLEYAEDLCCVQL